MLNRFLFISLLLVGGIFYYTSQQSSVQNPTEVRAAIDIGSGATKMKIAAVDLKTHKIASVIFETQIAVPFQTALSRSSDDTFSPEIMAEGIQAMHQFKKIAQEHQVSKVVAVATAAFRQAKNGQDYAATITEETGIEVYVIDQEEEGILAFNAAMANTHIDPSQAIVWDIGGGSQQLTLIDTENQYYVCKGDLASISFRDHIIESLQGNDIQTTTTPNPIAPPVAEQAIDYATFVVGQNIDPSIQEKMRAPKTTVFAVGSLFGYGIKSLAGNEPVITQELLQQAIDTVIGLSDTELQGGDFANVTVSNALLVLGTMKALGIDKIVIQDVNNADGALVHACFYHTPQEIIDNSLIA